MSFFSHRLLVFKRMVCVVIPQSSTFVLIKTGQYIVLFFSRRRLASLKIALPAIIIETKFAAFNVATARSRRT